MLRTAPRSSLSQREAEKAKQREKEEKEEAIFRAQEALEEKLEKYSTRRAPLGADRHHRRYWWGLAGHRPAVYVEDGEVGGCWGQGRPVGVCGDSLYWWFGLAAAGRQCQLNAACAVSGLAGTHGCADAFMPRLLLVQGRWGSVSSLAELDALVGSLDRRGIREMALAEVGAGLVP